MDSNVSQRCLKWSKWSFYMVCIVIRRFMEAFGVNWKKVPRTPPSKTEIPRCWPKCFLHENHCLSFQMPGRTQRMTSSAYSHVVQKHLPDKCLKSFTQARNHRYLSHLQRQARNHQYLWHLQTGKYCKFWCTANLQKSSVWKCCQASVQHLSFFGRTFLHDFSVRKYVISNIRRFCCFYA